MNTKHVKSANQYSQLPKKNLYTHWLFLIISIMLTTASVFAQTDKVDCKEHPLIPTRLPDYYIGNCEVNDYSAHTVITQQGEKTIEGKKTVLEYLLKPGGKAVSETYVRKNYMEAIKKQGATIEFENFGRGVGILKLSDGRTIWVDVTGYVGDGTPELTEHIYLTILEIAPMEQVITAETLGDDLKQTGKSVLYIQFETGKATISAESRRIIEQMASYLNSNKSVKVFIVGHTDNEGTYDLNIKLSEQRSAAVVAELITSFNVSASQIIAKGVGPLSPIATNSNESGRKLNRRVEMVLQ